MLKLILFLTIFTNIALAKPIFNPVRISKRCRWQPIARIICNIGISGEEKVYEGCQAALVSKDISDEDKMMIRSHEVCHKGFTQKVQSQKSN